ncbi:ATP-binding domain-containing protein [Sphingomonas qilianensis]|uniref:DNA 3'-5' helicase II n=1 Tax=Sphingomonas qilianensis TaxID=1736690 RepID=A0ABU9XSD2_9SPHN
MTDTIDSGTNQDLELRAVAAEALDAFATIADAAHADLRRRGMTLADLAVVNQATAEATAKQMREMTGQRIDDSQRLRREPAIARLVIADEDDQRETIYISNSGTVTQGKVRLCSYMSPKGRLAPLAIGDYRKIALPGGAQAFEVIDKITFKPSDERGEWDAQPAVKFRDKQAPLTIRSLRDLLREDGYSDAEIDELEAWHNDGASADDGNISEGLRRDALTAMELRVAPILDEFQDRIFRLPIDSQIAVLGPPGTGKTTTLVRRLRQKVDFAYLEEEERERVEDPDDAGLAHADSWLMFTPTELLRLYVKEAFGKEGVPVHDARLRTWDDHRREIGKGALRILSTGRGGGLVLKRDDALLLPETLLDQTSWYEAFDAFQKADFVEQLAAEATRLVEADDAGAAALGQQITAAIARSGDRPLQLLGELAGLHARLQAVAGAQRNQIRGALQEPLRGYARRQPEFLNALVRFTETLDSDEPDDIDDEDDDLDEEQAPTMRGSKLAEDIFVKAMRNRAVAQASGRSVAPTSRSGRLLGWLGERGLELPDLRGVGRQLLVQRAAARLVRAPVDYLRRISLRYRRFRRAMREEGQWYGAARAKSSDVHPAEVDVIILTMLRSSAAMASDRLLTQRLAERRPAILDDIARLRRHQVLVDEATDFSPVQLACMRSLAHPSTGSFFLSGDYNQRLTTTGSRSDQDLLWACPSLQIERIDVSYRQSRELADFARKLALHQGYEVSDRAPDDLVNIGWKPVFGASLDSLDAQAKWLSARIRDIIRLTEGAMPTIAVLMPTLASLEPLAEALSEEIADTNIRAVACPRGMVKGQAGDIRIFEVEHIKGLEFEAVFLMDIDGLRDGTPGLFDRYVYVGATRAATFLGLACHDVALPTELEGVTLGLADSW